MVHPRPRARCGQTTGRERADGESEYDSDSAAALSEYDAGFGAVGGDEWGDDGLSECISDFGFGFAGGDEWDDDDFLTQILASERTPEEWGRAWAQREGRLC